MNIEITTMVGCKNRCNFCPQATIISKYKQNGGVPLVPMDYSIYKLCIDKLPIKTHIFFSGMCEAFLNPKCSDMIEYAYKKGFPVSVYTTLVGMKVGDVERLKKIQFPHGEHGFIVHLPSTGNVEHIKIDDLYLEVISKIYESTIPAHYHYHGQSLHPDIKKFFQYKIATIQHFPAHSRAGNQSLGLLKRRRGKIGCLKVKLYGSYGHILLPNGTVSLCCQDYSLKHILGNLKYQTFEEILNCEEIKKIELGLKNPKIDILCRNCEFSYDVNLTAKLINQKVFLPDHHE